MKPSFHAVASTATFGLVASVVGFVTTPVTRAQDDLPAGKGKEAVVALCTNCHGSDAFTSIRLPRSGWAATVADMIARGASGTEAEVSQATDYLANHFGIPLKVNQASVAELTAGLSISEKDAEAIVRVRAERGPFKNLDDLVKVPGVDHARIEEQQANLVF